jgi:gentisate 1,2-dioxygenase
MEDDYISAFEYEKNVNPPLSYSPFYEKNANDGPVGVDFIDFSDVFRVSYKSTTPNLLASFIKLTEKENVFEATVASSPEYNAASHLFYVLSGNVTIITEENDEKTVGPGDIFITPCFHSIRIKNTGTEEVQLYYVNDSPLMNYLGSKAEKKIFKSAVYHHDFLIQNLERLSNPLNNRKGILLSNKDTEKLGVNTITPVLWALYNELPPNTVQKPHKHNSVALDLCIACDDNENVYTIMGDVLDDQGNILNPTKIHWKKGSMFITPPGLWHSHNNTGNTYAYVLPIQDAGLLLYQRILGIVLQR